MPKRYEKACKSRLAKADRNNCAVIATSIVARVPYNVAYNKYKEFGRKNGRGVYTPIIHNVINQLGCELTEITNKNGKPLKQKNGYNYTVNTIAERLKHGYYLVCVKDHCLAVVNGVVEDWTEGRRHRVESVYRVTVPRGSRS